MNVLRTVASAVLLLWALAVHADKPLAPADIPGTSRVAAEQVVELIQKTPTLVIVDARRPAEHAKGHIEGAHNLLDNDMTPTALAAIAPDHNTPLLFYCNGERCLRSSNAASKAVAWGYRRVYWFRGGWEEWLDKGLPIAR